MKCARLFFFNTHPLLFLNVKISILYYRIDVKYFFVKKDGFKTNCISLKTKTKTKTKTKIKKKTI
jgi:hypothetical protein